MIRGAAPLDGAWFGGSATLSPEAQIAIYREQYELRLPEAVRGEVPGLAALVGDEIDALIASYLQDHPPTSWSLDHVAHALPGWLEARGAPRVQVDMARLDAAVMAGFTAADAPALAPTDLGGRLRLRPSTVLLALATNVAALREALLCDHPPPDIQEGAFFVVIYRAELAMRHWLVPPALYALLDAWTEDATVAEVLARTLDRHPDAGPFLELWFKEIGQRQILAPSSH